MAGDGRKRPCSGVRRIALSATAVTRARPPTPGATGRTPRSRGFSSGIYCGAVLGLVTVLAVVDLNSGTLATGGELTVLERLIVRGRCQARCNELVSSGLTSGVCVCVCVFLRPHPPALFFHFNSRFRCVCVCV